uniref:hypothetical protein n=1 Tax=Mogibacterium sp. TaxID=2049035 RepID=UPI00257EE9E5
SFVLSLLLSVALSLSLLSFVSDEEEASESLSESELLAEPDSVCLSFLSLALALSAFLIALLLQPIKETSLPVYPNPEKPSSRRTIPS